MDQRRLILLGTLLLAVIAAGIHWYDSTATISQAQPESARQWAPESIVSGFAQTTFSESGVRHYELRADRVTHYSRQSAAEMVKPDIMFYRDNTATGAVVSDTTDWQASAANGVIHDDGETLTLKGDVKVVKPLRNADTLNFLTESLMIKPDQEVATTDDPVTVKQAQHVTTAVGLNIDIAAGRVQLLSQVKSQYVPVNTQQQ